jgi:predicted Zn-dependent protease
MREAKTAYAVNAGIEPKTFDHVYDQLRKWGHWQLVDEASKADIIVVLSSQNTFLGVANLGTVGSATATATTYGNVTTVNSSGSSSNILMPLVSQHRYLSVVDRKTGTLLTMVDCLPRGINGAARTGKILVDKLRDRFPKSER